MRVCDVGLPPDCQYFLDAAVEYGELDGMAHSALNLLADRNRIVEIIDKPQPVAYYSETALGARQGICYRLSAYARTVVASLDDAHQRAFVAQALIRERHGINDLADVLASWNYEDATVGGALTPWRRGCNMRIRADGVPTRRVLRRLQGPASIRRYVHGAVVSETVRHHSRLASGICALPWPEHPGEARLLDDLFTEQDRLRDERRKRAMAEFINRLPDRLKSLGNSLNRQKKRENRKRLVRSAMTADRLLGRDATRTFLRGETVALPATNDLVFQIRSENIGALGHGGVRVSLAAARGEKLAGLCLYFDKTPPLDQLVAIALHVESDNSSELLRTGNLYDLTEAGAVHPALQGRAKPDLLPLGNTPAFFRRATFGYDRARQDLMVKNYQRDFGEHYRQALEDVVWGAQASRLRRFWALMEPIEAA